MSQGAAAGVQQLRERLMQLMVQTNRTSMAQQTEFLGNYISKWSAGKQSMTYQQFVSSLQSLNLPLSNAGDVFAALDHDGSGAVNIKEFCDAIFESAGAGPPPRRDKPGSAMRSAGNAILGSGGTAYPPPPLGAVPENTRVNSSADFQSRPAPTPQRTNGSARATPVGSRRGSQQEAKRTSGSRNGGSQRAPAPGAVEIDISELLLDQFRQIIIQRAGSAGIHSLGRIFKNMDKDKNRRVSVEELSTGLDAFGLSMQYRDVLLLLNAMDKEGNGSLSFDEFMGAVRGGINKRRRGLIMLAFDVLDKTKDGTIQMDDIVKAYKPAHDPDVAAGRCGESAGLGNFLSQFDTVEKDGIVTREEFIEYYKNVSASIDDDDYFELMIRNAWHIPGGQGWCENTANVRILVTFANGAQKVVMIEDDLGLDVHDRAAVMAKLKAQGVLNVVQYSLSGPC